MRIFLLLCLLLSPAFAFDKAEKAPPLSANINAPMPDGEMSLEEYSRLFEMGLIGEEEQEEEFNPKLKEKIDFDGGEIIGLSAAPYKLQIEQNDFLAPYQKILDNQNTKINLFKTEKFALFSDSSKELSDYLTNNFKSTINASYRINSKLSLYGGHETWYVNPDASIGSKKFYFNPRLDLTDNIFLDYTGRYNQTTNNIEQEIGLNFRPKLFKNAASFGVKATSVTNENNEVQSRKLKFTTEFYLF